jgi:Type IV secretion system pilin
MKNIAQKFTALTAFAIVMSFVGSFAFATPTHAACNTRFLTFPTWYRGLVDDECNIDMSRDPIKNDIAVFVQILAINIIEILLHIVAYVSIAFIIVGGFKYITSAGSPDGNEKGRKTITNAVIGLIISIISIGIVNFIVTRLGAGGEVL